MYVLKHFRVDKMKHTVGTGPKPNRKNAKTEEEPISLTHK